MAATAAQIAQVRRMAGIAVGDATYTDIVVGGYIETYPLLDGDGLAPDDDDWTPVYDLHAAAADVLEERAAALALEFDFTADGASYHRSQQYEAIMAQCRYHRARRTPSTMTLVKWPEEEASDTPWIGNLPEGA
jgi:hypothetical protein